MGGALQRRPQPPLHHLRRRHRPSASIGDQRRPRLLTLSTRNHQDRAAAFQQESAGSDAIPAEIYKHGGLSDCALPGDVASRRSPQDFRDATIVHLYKRKGNRQICDIHRGISLLNITGKIFARIFLNRLNNHLEQGLLPKSQCGFRRHRETTDMIFATRQLQAKCQEMRTQLYSTFLELTKAFDTVNREGLWKIMQKFGCPERFYQMLRQLHDDMMARVTDNGGVSEAFSLTRRVKQGCVLAPILFSFMSSAMLMDAYRDERPGIRVAYRRTVTSICDGCTSSRVYPQPPSTNFCSPMTALLMQLLKDTCKRAWISSPPPARTSA
ncbi:hypothetical protein SprV_0200727000 [Sparganum proliferum]